MGIKKIGEVTLALGIFVGLMACDNYRKDQHIESSAADIIFTNGKIYTLDPEQPWVEAVAIKEGKYSYVGGETGAKSYMGEGTQVIDLQGKMAMPGINDAHSHPWQGGFELRFGCNFSFDATPEIIAERLKACIAKNPDADRIIGGNWTSEFFNLYDIGSPREWLDNISRDKAISLEDDAGHNEWVNSQALKFAGISRDTPDPEGGTIVRDADGEANGLLLESARLLVSGLRDLTVEQYMVAISAAVKSAHQFGITGLNEARTPFPASEAYKRLDDQGALNVHMTTSLQTNRGYRDKPLDIEKLKAQRDQHRSTHVHTSFIKMFLDGVPTDARSAMMLEPYIVNEKYPAPTKGHQLINSALLEQDLIALDKEGFTVKIHTAGDGSVRAALDVIAKVREANGDSGLRHELAHAGYIHTEDVPRFAQLNVTADFSPYIWFPSPIIDSIAGAIGDRSARYWPTKDLLDSGANLLVGSDWPSAVEDMNPWPGLEALVTRKNPFEDGDETLWPEQAISLEQALEIFTMGGARAYRLEAITGSIELGKSANFIVLNQNLFEIEPERISDTQVQMTWFEGQLVYESGSSVVVK